MSDLRASFPPTKLERGTALRLGAAAVPALLFAYAVSLAARPLLPVDETRYVSVAWEMWRRGEFLVPHLNGEPYSHKPPLLFWLIHAGWWVFGVNEWWPRLLPVLFAAGALALTARLAGLLWPREPACAESAGWFLLGTVLFLVFGTLVLFDMPLLFFSTAAVAGAIGAFRSHRPGGLAGFGLALGLGILTKGPVILVHTLPVALALPWLDAKERRIRSAPWYAGVLAAIVLAAAIALAWALPAAAKGGAAYAEDLLWRQSAGRVAQSFAHARPIWWYLPFLPVLAAPWLLWPAWWRSMREALRFRGEFGVRVALLWFLAAVVILSFASGKQIHYLLPELVPLALLAGRGFMSLHQGGGEGSHPAPTARVFAWVLGTAAIGAGLGAVLIGSGTIPVRLPAVSERIRLEALSAGLLGGALAVACASRPLPRGVASVRRLALLTAAVAALGIFGAFSVLDPIYDVRPVAVELARLEKEGYHIAQVGKYHGQYHFAGRLEHPIESLQEAEVPWWCTAHPRSAVLVYYREEEFEAHKRRWERLGLQPLFAGFFRGRIVAAWDAETAARRRAIFPP